MTGKSVAPILLLFLLPACGVSLRTTPFSPGKYPPQPPEHPLQMYSTKAPECPYEELGLLHAEPKTGLTKWQQVVDAFFARARHLGGDGVILRQETEVRARDDGELVGDEVLAGTVIRYQNAGCQR